MRKGPAGSLSRSLHFGHSALYSEIDRRATEVEPRVIAWRRDIHEHPELSFQEVHTSKLVAEHLNVDD